MNDHLSRRDLLRRSAAGAAGAVTAGTVGTLAVPALSSDAAALAAPRTSTLVVVFLRGGADGLSLVAPVADPAYSTARPTIAVPQAAARPLTGPGADTRFGFHPAAERIAAMYASGSAAVTVGTGLPTGVRSHFDDQAVIESAGPDRLSGWGGRFLSATARPTDDSLRAVSVSSGVPGSLRGYAAVSAPYLDELAALSWGPAPAKLGALVESTYRRPGGHPLLAAWSAPALGAATRLPAEASRTVPDTWPKSAAAKQFWPVARLIQMGVGVQVANIDVGGWDTHEGMGAATTTTARMHALVAGLDAGIGAFFDAIGPAAAATTTMVVMTEFGRRVAENSSGGTDHGRSFPMLVLGGGVRPGVFGQWPGLAPASLDGGDVAVRTDYRSVLAELLARRLGATSAQLSTSFPGADVSPARFLGLCR